MNIHLPEDLESSFRSLVRGGRYASVDEAIAEAARRLLREVNEQAGSSQLGSTVDLGSGSIGAMQDAARELDEAMGHALALKQAPSSGASMTERELLQHMIDVGLMTQLPDSDADFDDPDDQPIEIQGEPLSEVIIRERR